MNHEEAVYEEECLTHFRKLKLRDKGRILERMETMIENDERKAAAICAELSKIFTVTYCGKPVEKEEKDDRTQNF